MKTSERIEKIIILFTALTCVLIPILDFIGALENFEWLSNRIHVMIMLAIGVLALFLIVTLKRIEEKSEDQTDKIITKIASDERDKEIVDSIKKLWDERESDISRLFDHIALNSKSWDTESLKAFLDDTFIEITNGDFLGTKLFNPWDFTLTAIDFNGIFIYHPSKSIISTRGVSSYPYSHVLQKRYGTIVYKNSDMSEQMRHITERRFRGGIRLTKLHFREYVRLNAIVVFESHINILHQIERIDFTEFQKPSYERLGIDKSLLDSAKLKIIEATYGTSKKKIDVTKEIIQNVINNKLNIKASNDIAGDPDPDHTKILTIKYLINDRELVSKYREYRQAILP